jgi:hypothetical protein
MAAAAVDVDAAMAAAAEAAADTAGALQVPMSAVLEVPVWRALGVSVAGAVEAFVCTALEVSVYTADAHFSDAASAAVVVAAEAVGDAELAGYGHPSGDGSTPAGPNPRLRLNLASRPTESHKQRRLRQRSDESHRPSSAASRA